MKNLLELTEMDGTKIYLNIEHINYFYDIKERMALDRVEEKTHTQIHLTNNWIKVTETSERIKAMIFNLRNQAYKVN